MDDALMFDKSPVSKALFRHLNSKFGQVATPKALLKCCVIVACKLERPRVSMMDIAPSRCLKTYTSTEVMDIFDQDFWMSVQSDFTLHALRRYRKKLLEGKCLFVNDGTTLFASKSQRAKDRLVGGLSELLADEKYVYQDFGTKFSLEGRITLVMNMTSEAYLNYKDRLFGLTFSERLLFSGAPKRLEAFKLVNGKRSSKDISRKTGRSLSSVLNDIKIMRDMGH